jgi:hypothetical protein
MVRGALLLIVVLVDLMALGPAEGLPWTPTELEAGGSQRRTDEGGPPAAPEDRVLNVAYFSSAQLSDVERIFAEIGFEVRTHDVEELSSPGAPAPETLLRLVILEQGAQRWGINPAALGAMIGRQEPPSAVYLFASPIRRVLGIANKRDGYLSAEAVGRAFGRVAVHEIVHAYAPDHPHSGWGITGHAQDARSLTQAGIVLDERAARAFTEAWQRLMAARAPLAEG